jgi:glycosyltransferase involved in cell wall biosynthesis
MHGIVKRTILFVHQSADLYGSDRVLLALVSRLDRERFLPIVLLPVDGPLVAEFQAAGVECHLVEITRLSRATLSARGLFSLPFNLLKSMRSIDRVLAGRSIDIVHSNTLAVLSSPLWARWHRVPHIWHVHEIIVNPKFVRKAYSYLLGWFADCIVCVSQATKVNLIQDKPALLNKITVVWNGLERTSPVDRNEVVAYHEQLAVAEPEVLIVLVGRINRWKGQPILVEAAGLLWQQGIRNVRYLFVGSAPDGQGHFMDELHNSINLSPAKKMFTLQGFTNNLWVVWDACDVAVIPSTEPEPFGMVALEAMAAAKPVIAANHGGLKEIVVAGETGLLVSPGSANDLAEAIKLLVSDAPLRKRMGVAGELRYRQEFTLDRYVVNMSKIYEQIWS